MFIFRPVGEAIAKLVLLKRELGGSHLAGVLKDGQGGVDGLNTAGKLVVSPEGTHVYVTAYDDDAGELAPA